MLWNLLFTTPQRLVILSPPLDICTLPPPALVWMVFTAFTLDGGSAAMLIPSVLAAIISGGINFMVFWNRLGTRSQKKALAAIGWA